MEMSGVSVSAIGGDANMGIRVTDAASIMVQKQSMEHQAANILKLTESVPEVEAPKVASGPGQIIDIKV